MRATRHLLVFVILLGITSAAFGHVAPTPAMYDSAGQPPEDRTCARCHTGVNHVNPPGQIGLRVSLDKPGDSTTYRTDDGPYTLTFTLDDVDQRLGGIEASMLDAGHRSVGRFYIDPAAPWTSLVRIDRKGNREYLHHGYPYGIQEDVPGRRKTWTILWYPPHIDAGRVTLYAAGVAATNAGTHDVAGDKVYTVTRALDFAQPSENADLDGDGDLDHRDVFLFLRQWERSRPTPTPIGE